MDTAMSMRRTASASAEVAAALSPDSIARRADLTKERTVERTCLLRSVRRRVCLMRFLLDS